VITSLYKIWQLIKSIFETAETDWSYSDTHPANENAVLTVPGETGKTHFITHVGASFEADNAAGKVELLTNSTTVMESFITGQPLEIEFSTALKGKEGEDTTLTLINDTQNQATIFISGYTKIT
jgi:hypothetical protein